MLPVTVATITLYQPLTVLLAQWSQDVLSQVIPTPVTIVADPYLPWFGDVHSLSIASTLPSRRFALVNVAVCVAVVALSLLASDSLKPFVFYLRMCCAVHLVSSLVFAFAPESFPYTLTEYSSLYIRQQVSIWTFISLVSGLTIGMLAAGGLARYVAYSVTMLNAVVFGCLRYVVYLFLLSAGSSIYMAVLFFGFGVLFDLMQVVAIYALFARHVSRKMERPEWKERWEWS